MVRDLQPVRLWALDAYVVTLEERNDASVIAWLVDTACMYYCLGSVVYVLRFVCDTLLVYDIT